VDEEMEELDKSYVVYHLDDYFQEVYFETKKVIYLPWEDKR
jgi:16S rRNA (guanine527-N7)-methyltransferase